MVRRGNRCASNDHGIFKCEKYIYLECFRTAYKKNTLNDEVALQQGRHKLHDGTLVGIIPRRSYNQSIRMIKVELIISYRPCDAYRLFEIYER